jgi:hypothetical protein
MRRRLVILLGGSLLLGCQQQSERRAPAVRVVEKPVATQRVEERVGEEISAADAVLGLAGVLSKNARDVAYLQQLTLMMQARLAAQVKVLASQNDPEGMARAVRVLAFADGMSRFLADTLTSSGDARERETLVAWALEPAHAMVVAGAYDRETAGRAAAARELGKLSGEHADVMLARLIDDREREVSLAAMDACWDRAASAAVVDALWNKAIVNGLRSMGAAIDFVGAGRERDERLRGPRVLTFRGRVLQDYEYNLQLSFRAQDADVATDLLIHFKSGLVKKRAEELFELLRRGPANMQLVRYVLSSRFGTVSMHTTRLLQAYKPANAIPVLLELIEHAPNDGQEQTINGQKVYFSTRADLIGFVVGMAQLDRETYHVGQMRNWGAAWVILGGAKEEGEAVAKLKAWGRGR